MLSGWIVKMAERCGYLAQYTSVPGVAQRTGATIYYLELFPHEEAKKAGRPPVLALMPMPGDVDIVIASELMEAGRAVSRGFVTADRTTLIASTHRDYAISEKAAMGDGTADAQTVLEAIRAHAKHLVAFDMKASAEAVGSVISSSLFGALAGAGALPFPREAYEDTLREGGRMLEANLAAFDAAYDLARKNVAGGAHGAEPSPSSPLPHQSQLQSASLALAEGKPAAVRDMLNRIPAELPPAVHDLAVEGARRCVDYQDLAYAGLYLDRLALVARSDDGARGFQLSGVVARQLALWMSYEDTIRVADLKTRSSRFDRARKEVRAKPDQIVYLTEFMHPRVREIADSLPAPLGHMVLDTPWINKFVGRFCRKGRYIHSTKLGGFFLLKSLSALRRIRRSTLRYQEEQARIERWLARIEDLAGSHYDLALEIGRCQNLVKGYGDTHARGLGNFNRLMGAVDMLKSRADGAALLAELRAAALADDQGQALTEKLAGLSRSPEKGRKT